MALYVVATPIGNLSDASPRMVEILGGVALIAAEDTRVTGNLLRHFGISVPMTSLHRYNEGDKATGIVRRMTEESIDVALVTDAGTPAISDPGYLLVREAIVAGIEVYAIAGPTALAAAVSVSGFDARIFTFYGFLPREHGDLVKKLLSIGRSDVPVAVVYESPHRVIALMEAVCEALPGCEACVCCDLTKLHEKTLHGAAEDVLALLRANPKTNKGEYCVVLDMRAVQVADAPKAPDASVEAQLVDCLLSGMAMSDALALLQARGIRKNEAKRAALRVRAFIDEMNGE